MLLIAGVGAPNVPRGPFVRANGASQQVAPSGDFGSLGGSPGAWLGMCIKRGFFSQGLQGFCCLKALRFAAFWVSGSGSAALPWPHICSASISKSVIPQNEVSGVSKRFPWALPFRVFIYFGPGQYVLPSPQRLVFLQEALVKIISCV